MTAPSSIAGPILALDTSTRTASVALCDGDQSFSQTRQVTTHSEGLLLLIESVLTQAGRALADVRAIVCGLGPGSFTGLRIGLATAKGLSFALDCPLVGVCSLDAVVAFQGASGPPDSDSLESGSRVLCAMDARRGEVFCALYLGGKRVAGPVALKPDAVVGWCAEQAGTGVDAIVGNATVLYPELAAKSAAQVVVFDHAPAAALVPLAVLSSKAGDSSLAVEPIYARAPDVRPPSVAQTRRKVSEPPVEAAGIDRAAAIEAFRQTGLRLDAVGRWWHEGELIEHQRLAATLHRWIDQLPDGRFILRLDDTRYAYIDVDDAPYVVRLLRLDAGGVHVTLSDGTEERLTAGDLAIREGADSALYVQVKSGRFEARLTPSAQLALADHVDEQDGSFGLRLGEHFVAVNSR